LWWYTLIFHIYWAVKHKVGKKVEKSSTYQYIEKQNSEALNKKLKQNKKSNINNSNDNKINQNEDIINTITLNNNK
jgi:hypothetical protein